MPENHIDRIASGLNEGPPHIGAESEGIATNIQTLEVVHQIAGQQPTQAIKQWIAAQAATHGQDQQNPSEAITPDVPETTVETNPPPLKSPRSAAAAQRLLAVIIDQALQNLTAGEVQLLHGAAWRAPNLTTADASRHVPFWKQIYYESQIERHGDKIGAAAGDHLNLSLPWLAMNGTDEEDISKKMIEMTARMRLIAGALSTAISAASPLYYYANGGQTNPTYSTALTPWESARLGHVWPNRTIMDVSGLYDSDIRFRETLEGYRENGILKTGRDLWIPVRAQSETNYQGQTFAQICEENGIDLEEEGGRQRARNLFMASLEHGPNGQDNPYKDDPVWKAIEAARQAMLLANINAPRNRVEVRILETPPAFEGMTSYKYIKAVHTFLELLFIYLSTNPDCVRNLAYTEGNLTAAKANEQKVLLGGMDARVRWIPDMTTTTPREILQNLLLEMDELIQGLEQNGILRNEDLATIRELAQGALLPPAERIRREVKAWYSKLKLDNRHNPRMLPDDEYAKSLLVRNRNAMPLELAEIEEELSSLPQSDQLYIQHLLNIAKQQPAQTA
jgi:hypothetical protein